MGKSRRLSRGCGLPPQYWGGGEQQRPGQRERERVTLLGQCTLCSVYTTALTHSHVHVLISEQLPQVCDQPELMWFSNIHFNL